MRAPKWLLDGDEPITDRVTAALWHEVGRHDDRDTITRTYHTTPIEAARRDRGATDVAVVCRVCHERVPLRVVDGASARRRRVVSRALPVAWVLLTGILLVAADEVADSRGLLPASGAWGIVAGLVVFFGVGMSTMWLTSVADPGADGVVVLAPGRARRRHLIGSDRSAVVTVEEQRSTP